jgi:zinc transporter ZupT
MLVAMRRLRDFFKRRESVMREVAGGFVKLLGVIMGAVTLAISTAALSQM